MASKSLALTALEQCHSSSKSVGVLIWLSALPPPPEKVRAGRTVCPRNV